MDLRLVADLRRLADLITDDRWGFSLVRVVNASEWPTAALRPRRAR